MNRNNDEGGEDGKKIYETVGPSHHFTKFEDICEFDEAFWEVTKELPIRTGSILRLSSEAYSRWRVKVTEENKEQLVERYDEFRLKDYRERDNNREIKNVEKTPFSRTMRNSMVRIMGHLAKEIMLSRDDGEMEHTVCDLACGLGQSVSALASALYAEEETRGLLERTRFYLVDYSAAKLDKVRETLLKYNAAEVELRAVKDTRFLDNTSKEFDIIMSLCHFHKKPLFPLGTLPIYMALHVRKRKPLNGWKERMRTKTP